MTRPAISDTLYLIEAISFPRCGFPKKVAS